MLYTKIQPQSFLNSGEEGFYMFCHIWAWQPSFTMAQNHLDVLSTSFRQKSDENCSRGLTEEDIQRFHDFIHVNSPGARVDNPKTFNF